MMFFKRTVRVKSLAFSLLAPILSVLASLPLHDAVARPSDRFSAPYAAPAAPVPSFDDLRKRAEAGNADAQFDVGLACQLGLGTRRDLTAARQWFSRAAAQNHARAQAGLGFLLLTGQGGPVDLAGAEKALRAAGEQGEASAWANLAELALASPDKRAEAVALLERAVKGGAVNARYRLGRLLIEGELVPADAARGRALLEEAAAQGHPHSQAYLAYMVLEDQAADLDPARAFAMVQRAANADLAEAANEVGRFYWRGLATPRSPQQAAKWFARAGELGEVNGWYNLALLHEAGDLGKPDLAEARKLAVRAASQGHLMATGMAGRMLYRGEGGPRDRAAAYPYLKRLAEEEDVADAQNMLASLLMSGDGAPANPAAAMDWWEKAALQGHGGAVNNFATYLATGRGRKADPARARQLLAAQAEKDYAPSQFRWALWQEQGWQGTPKDLKAALDWFRRAANNGHGAAAFKYASYLEAGEGIAVDLPGAVRWYRTGAERGNAPAQFQLARLMFNGEGGPADPAGAMRWLERSAGQGYPEALFVLGDMIWRGEGRPADPPLAWAYLRLAEDAGVAEAGDNRRFIESRLKPAEQEKAVAAVNRLAGAIRREREDE